MNSRKALKPKYFDNETMHLSYIEGQTHIHSDPWLNHGTITRRGMKFSIKDLFNKCDQISSFLQIWSHLLKKSLMENFIFCAMECTKFAITLKQSATCCNQNTEIFLVARPPTYWWFYCYFCFLGNDK